MKPFSDFIFLKKKFRIHFFVLKKKQSITVFEFVQKKQREKKHSEKKMYKTTKDYSAACIVLFVATLLAYSLGFTALLAPLPASVAPATAIPVNGSKPMVGTQVTRSIVPTSDATFTLGTQSKPFQSIFAVNTNNSITNDLVHQTSSIALGNLITMGSQSSILDSGVSPDELQGGPYVSLNGSQMQGSIDMDSNSLVNVGTINSKPASNLITCESSVMGHFVGFVEHGNVREAGIAASDVVIVTTTPTEGHLAQFGATSHLLVESTLEESKIMTGPGANTTNVLAAFTANENEIKVTAVTIGSLALRNNYVPLDNGTFAEDAALTFTTRQATSTDVYCVFADSLTISTSTIVPFVGLQTVSVTEPAVFIPDFRSVLMYSGEPQWVIITISFTAWTGEAAFVADFAIATSETELTGVGANMQPFGIGTDTTASRSYTLSRVAKMESGKLVGLTRFNNLSEIQINSILINITPKN